MGRVANNREVVQIDDISKAPTYGVRMRLCASGTTRGSAKRYSRYSCDPPYRATMRNLSPSRSQRFPNLASQKRVAFSRIASKTGCKSPGDEPMTRKISAVAVCRSSSSSRSRASSAIFLSLPPTDDGRLRVTFGALRRFSVAALRCRALTGSPTALERRTGVFDVFSSDHAGYRYDDPEGKMKHGRRR
jgi:hypothetical protein